MANSIVIMLRSAIVSEVMFSHTKKNLPAIIISDVSSALYYISIGNLC